MSCLELTLTFNNTIVQSPEEADGEISLSAGSDIEVSFGKNLETTSYRLLLQARNSSGLTTPVILKTKEEDKITIDLSFDSIVTYNAKVL